MAMLERMIARGKKLEDPTPGVKPSWKIKQENGKILEEVLSTTESKRKDRRRSRNLSSEKRDRKISMPRENMEKRSKSSIYDEENLRKSGVTKVKDTVVKDLLKEELLRSSTAVKLGTSLDKFDNFDKPVDIKSRIQNASGRELRRLNHAAHKIQASFILVSYVHVLMMIFRR
jgi:hypothetical protein